MKNLSSGFLKERYFCRFTTFFFYICPYIFGGIAVETRLLYRNLAMSLLSACPKVQAASIPDPYDASLLSADSIMKKVIFFAPFYESIIDDYRADLYIKGKVNLRKKNHILRFILPCSASGKE